MVDESRSRQPGSVFLRAWTPSKQHKQTIMSSTIGTNVGALSAAFYLSQNNDALNKSIKRLASGSRLADPTDDAAGVAVSGRLDANIARLNAAAESAGNIISFGQTTDGFL